MASPIPSTSAHIISLLNASATTPYIGEPVSQLEHSLQCAHLATTSDPPSSDERVVAALLHDIGQFVPEAELNAVLGKAVTVKDMTPEYESGRSKSSVGRVGHEELGARYLEALGFSEAVTKLVRAHVAAKRYLCAVDTNYHDALSDASKKSLEFQGGPMSKEEMELFAKDVHCSDMCRLRRWDDAAKFLNLEVPRPEVYQPIVEKVLEMS
jgi:predicted HD phosphohydrolase